MARQGFRKGKGLEEKGQSIVAPIQIDQEIDRHGLGFQKGSLRQ